MKALTLWQPWASLIACGAKTMETRHWRCKYRGPLAIHAATKPLPTREPYVVMDELHIAGFRPDHDWPLGVIVCVVRMFDCVPTELIGFSQSQVEAFEPVWGDYSRGRWAWIFKDIEPLPVPLPAKGHQGLWEWER